MPSFESFPLRAELLANLKSLAYDEATAIQAATLPEALNGRDILAQAQTGAGKTAAFALPLLNALQVKRFRIQALVLCPTRELAAQVAAELRKLARQIHNIKILSLCGGQPIGPQIASLEHGAHIIVGTPGRIEDHLRKGRLHLAELRTLVLDEADRMLDMGFRDSIDTIVEACPAKRQNLLFSATYSDAVRSVAASYLYKPAQISVEAQHQHKNIEQRFYRIQDGDQRFEAVLLLLMAEHAESAIVFCHTKKEVQECAAYLQQHGLVALALQGDMDQRDRDRTLVRFANGSATVLVATDVAARGLDIDDVQLVLNCQLSRDVEVHTHRVGRTGRAGGQGLACSLFTDKERYKLEALSEARGLEAELYDLPERGLLQQDAPQPRMHTLQLDLGKKQKLRAGDIVGALCKDNTLSFDELGKIDVLPMTSFVAVQRNKASKALERLKSGKIKGRQIKVRLLRR